MSETKRKPWVFDFMKRVESAFQDDAIDSTDVGYLFLLTQMNHRGGPVVLHSHVRIAERFRLSRENTGRRLAKYERLGLVKAMRKPVSPGRHGGPGQTRQYRLLSESGDAHVTPIDRSSDADVTPFQHSCDEWCDGTCDAGVTPTRTLEEQDAPPGSSTFREPSPTGLVPAHRPAMGGAFDLHAARDHFNALRDLLADEPTPEIWQLGHSGSTVEVPTPWDCTDLLAATVEGLAASDEVSSVTGLLRKVRKSAVEERNEASAALSALGGLWKQYCGSSALVAFCDTCDYPPSLCGCPRAVVA